MTLGAGIAIAAMWAAAGVAIWRLGPWGCFVAFLALCATAMVVTGHG